MTGRRDPGSRFHPSVRRVKRSINRHLANIMVVQTARRRVGTRMVGRHSHARGNQPTPVRAKHEPARYSIQCVITYANISHQNQDAYMTNKRIVLPGTSTLSQNVLLRMLSMATPLPIWSSVMLGAMVGGNVDMSITGPISPSNWKSLRSFDGSR